MAILSENTVVNDPKTGVSVSLLAGEQVPAWAVEQVGDHLVKGGDVEADTDYSDQKAADLRREIDRRNATREPSSEEYIKPDGLSKDALISALEADDERQTEAETEDNTTN
jgi:hypothetical protein